MNNFNYKNLILISIDDLRSDCVGANKNKGLLRQYGLKAQLKTPNLDRFVREGVFFDQCFSAAPYTTASHASILTGQWPWRHGLKNFYKEKLKSSTVLSLLKKKGFKALFQTDWPFIFKPLGFFQGADQAITGDFKKSLQWMRANKKSNLACFFHFSDVHPLYFSPLFGPDQKDAQISEFLSLRKEKVQNIFKMHEAGKYNEIMDIYIRRVNEFDRGRFKGFIAFLESSGFLEDSLLVIFSDHGEKWGQGQRSHNDAIHHRHSLSDEVLRVPLIFWGKGMNKCGISQTVRTIDIVPTVFSLLNVKKNPEFNGLDLFGGGRDDLEAHAFLYQPNASFLKKMRFSSIKALEKEKFFSKVFDREKKDFYCQSMFRDNGRKLVRYFSPEGQIIEEQKYRVGKNHEKKVRPADSFDALHKKLDGYDRLYLDQKASKAKRIPEGIKKQLQNLGYKI